MRNIFKYIFLFPSLITIFSGFVYAKDFQNEMWTFVYPNDWVIKNEANKVIVTPVINIEKAKAKFSLHHKKLSAQLLKQGNKKLLEMTAISILSAEHQAMLGSNNEVEVRKVKRPKAEKDKTEKDREEEKKLQEERKKQIEKKMQREIDLKDKYKVNAKKESQFLGYPSIYIEMEMVIEKETFQKQIHIAIYKDYIITAILYFSKDNEKETLPILQQIFQTLKLR